MEKNAGLKVLAGAAAALVLLLVLGLTSTAEPGKAQRRESAVEVMRAAIAMAEPGGAEAQNTRREGVYTFLLAGQDNGNGNTDTIMVIRLDTLNRTIDAVSIPRDTMINTAWKIRKINAAYSMGPYNGLSGAECLAAHVAELTGFPVDGYAVVDLRAFVEIVDAMGGVWFEVPMAMDYEDPSQNLAIHLKAGYQLLNGQQALGLCRFRSGYASADLGRIDMQHRFLKACAGQFIEKGSIPNAVRVVEILADSVETDMSAGKIAWFLAQALRCPAENIRFHTAPNRLDTVGGFSYTILELEPWLQLINRCLDPYELPLTAADLNVVFIQDGALGFTAAPCFAA